jgi:hypothetical protein
MADIEESENLKEEISQYDKDEIDNYIVTIKKEIQLLNENTEQLESENTESDINYVESFIRIYESKIIEQSDEMERLFSEVQELKFTHEYIKGKKEEYESIVTSEKLINLIYKIRRIREIKGEIYHFLEQKGIPSPSK